MFGKTFDAYTLGVWHFKEGTGTSIADQDAAFDMTAEHGFVWSVANPKYGRWGDFTAADSYVYYNDSSGNFNLTGGTVEAFIRTGSNSGAGSRLVTRNASNEQDHFFLGINGADNGDQTVVGATTLQANTNYHVAMTCDGNGTAKVYLNGTEDGSSNSGTYTRLYTDAALAIGGRHYGSHIRFNGYINHVRVSNGVRTSFPYGFSDTVTVSQGDEEGTQPPASSFQLYTGFSNGKIYSWDGTTTWTEVFDTRRLIWYETGGDANKVVGDTAATETAQAQSFQLAAEQTIKSVELYLKKAAGTPGDITVRIETNSTDKPSGTLAHANATTTIPAFTTTSYAWKEAIFAATFTLSATTTYWIVLKTAAAENDQNYTWQSDDTSPSFTSGTMAASTDGGTNWSAVTGSDAYIRVKGRESSVYCSLVSSIGGTQKAYWGVGDITNETDGDARLYTYNGSIYTLAKSFTDGVSSAVTSITEYASSIYAATAPQAYILTSADGTTWSTSKQIRTPQNPGYVYAMQEYNQRLYVVGGSPEFLPNERYNGFFYTFDGVTWQSVYPFEHTLPLSLGFYDAFLFIGTYGGQVYIFDTSTLDPLINFKDDYDYSVQVSGYKFFDDKMYILLSPQINSGETNSSVWMFERHGISSANAIPTGLSFTKLQHAVQVNNHLMIGTDNGYVLRLDDNSYEASGWLQTSYFDAILPSIEKLYNELKIMTDPIPTGTSILVEYKFKETDSWTTLGTINTIGATSSTLAFATGVVSTKISFRYTLSTSDTSLTPVIRETILKYTLNPERKWQWNLRLLIKGTSTKDRMILLDKSQESSSAANLRTAIELAQNSDSLITFYDIDGTAYTVLFNSLDEASWVVNNTTNDYNENSVAISLLEA
jgi:hypothetical protein